MGRELVGLVVGAAEMIAGRGGRDKKTRTKSWYVDGEAD